jgi:N-acetylglucosamine-6-phosphate deacetylase
VLVIAPRVVPATGSTVLAPGYVEFHGGLITKVGEGAPPRPADVALPGGVLVPGLIDLQLNGYRGVDLAQADEAGWSALVARLPETGTTAFLGTCLTGRVPDLAGRLRYVAEITGRMPPGARLLGVHLEGPFLSPAWPGAHPRQLIVPPSPAAVADLLAAGEGVLRLVTLAPETEGGLAAVTALAAAGVLVSIGHSDATAAQVAAAADAGARMVTHLFNAQRPLHHREPGVPGQALTDPRLTSGLIADLHHVAAPVCAIAAAAAPGRICLVTDATAATGLPPGRYLLAGAPAELPAGDSVPPARPDGTLAGSALRLDRAVANAARSGMGLAGAVAAATRIPADLIGRPDLGRLAPGAAADLAWLGDDLRTLATWVGGEQVFSAPAREGRLEPPGGPCAGPPAPVGGSPAGPR